MFPSDGFRLVSARLELLRAAVVAIVVASTFGLVVVVTFVGAELVPVTFPVLVAFPLRRAHQLPGQETATGLQQSVSLAAPV